MEGIKNRDKILTGNIRKVLIGLALPVILANAIQTIYGVVDTYWVSKLAEGDIAVGAVNFVWPMIFVTMALGIGMNRSSPQSKSLAVTIDMPFSAAVTIRARGSFLLYTPLSVSIRYLYPKPAPISLTKTYQ